MKRCLDIFGAGLGLIVLLPVFALISVCIWLEDRGSPLFHQKRVGRHGRFFELMKFRSMRTGTRGATITAGGDPRCTRVGRVLRRYKLDELPQLWNVLRGDMSLVGPRPEIPLFVDASAPVWQDVLSVRPGITDLASLIYRNEEELLRLAADVEREYRERILPDKLQLNLQYLKRQSMTGDLYIILLTLRYSLFPAAFDSGRVRQLAG
ncbi:MAG: sugar transferase [Acidobacteriia bacterium]|nr:sugar transferase [Terriglobia bacterium]